MEQDRGQIPYEEAQRLQAIAGKIAASEAAQGAVGCETTQAVQHAIGYENAGVAKDVMVSGSAQDVIYGLRRRLRDERANAGNLQRAVFILERNPEFAELIWLIRSGLI